MVKKKASNILLIFSYLLETIKEIQEEINQENDEYNSLSKDEIDQYEKCLKFEKIKKSSYEILEIHLGRGAFGKVNKCRYQNDEYAIKILEPNSGNEDRLKLIKEIDMMMKMKDKNTLNCKGYDIDCKKVFIIMDLCKGGSVYDLIHSEKRELSEKQKQEIILQTARGLQYLHSKKIIHRDIKSQNILLKEKVLDESSVIEIKISDFGESKSLIEQYCITYAGTPLYMSPEVIRGDPYTFKADVYSYGVYVWEIYSGLIPYSYEKSYNLGQFDEKIGNAQIKLDLDKLRKETPTKIKELIEKCLNYDADKRPDFNNIIRELLIIIYN